MPSAHPAEDPKLFLGSLRSAAPIPYHHHHHHRHHHAASTGPIKARSALNNITGITQPCRFGGFTLLPALLRSGLFYEEDVQRELNLEQLFCFDARQRSLSRLDVAVVAKTSERYLRIRCNWGACWVTPLLLAMGAVVSVNGI